MKNKRQAETFPYLNKPIEDEQHDWIGMSKYADYLKEAMDRGAEMIAVTADFGTGKSSLIQLLKKKCGVLWYRVFEVNLWCHLEENQAGSAEIHKAFLYQMANQISPRLGSYVSKRMSENYGLLQLRLGRAWLGIAVILGLFCLGASRILPEMADMLENQFDVLKGTTGALTVAAGVLGLLFLWFVLAHSEILFSSKSSEGDRKWKDLDAAELFHNQILTRKLWNFWKHTVIIIEDLDRSNSENEVLVFLKEIRKYYLAPRKSHARIKCLNKKITFIVNIKHETSLLNEKQDPQLYPKVFDFVLDLKKINIDNYDRILEGLLLEKKEALQELSLLPEGVEITGEKVMNIPGMQWMIRGQSLDVREVKNRLNTALLLYASLCSKFGSEKISFEKCAVVSYITLEFPEEYQRMGDHTLDELMKGYLCGNCNKVEDFESVLGETNAEYVKVVHQLVQEHLIDGNYRTYFYNYPKGSHLLSLEEELIYNIILYPDMALPDKLEELIQKVKANRPEALQEAFEKLNSLRLPFPNIVLESPELFAYAWEYEKNGTKRLIGDLESQYGSDIAIHDIRKILHFPNRKEYVGESMAKELCELWEKEYSSGTIEELRTWLCEDFPEEILWYQKLFGVDHAPLNLREITAFPKVAQILSVICETKEPWEAESLQAIHRRIIDEKAWKEIPERCNEFYRFVLELGVLDSEEFLQILLLYMRESVRICPELEKDLVILLEEYPSHHAEYLELLNATAVSGWAEQTAESVQELGIRQGLNTEACNILLEKGMYQEYLYHMVRDRLTEVAFENEEMIKAYSEIEYSLYQSDSAAWFQVRRHLIAHYENILGQYSFLFDKGNPFPEKEELQEVDNIPAFLKLLCPGDVTEEEVPLLAEWFGGRYRSGQTAFAIFLFLCELEAEVCRALFYRMNLQVVNYGRMAKNKKAVIRAKMTPLLDLEEPMEALKYMEHIGEMDEVLERRIGSELQKNEEVRIKYVNLVNQFHKPSDLTMKNLIQMTWLYHYCDEVTQELYERKAYGKYVSSKVLGKKVFEIEYDKKEVLWPVYLDILGSEYYGNVRKAISQNREFLRQVMKERAYQGMREENRMYFASVYQDVECLQDAETYGEEFLRNYLRRIEGFEDEAAAQEFLELLGRHKELISDEEIYNHVHPKLVSPTLKGKYTRCRKQK